jgi:hypothetical protein
MGQASLPLVSSTQNPPIYYRREVGGCSWGINELSFAPYQGVWYQFLLYFCIILPSFLPIFPVVVSCIIFVRIVLTSKKKVKSYRTQLDSHQVHTSLSLNLGSLQATLKTPDSLCPKQSLEGPVPVSELSQMSTNSQVEPRLNKVRGGNSDVAHQATTTMYIVTTLYIIFNVPFWSFTLAVMLFKADHLKWVNTNGLYIHNFLYRTSVVMNAACNPIVYFARIQALRRMWSIKRIFKCYFPGRFQGLNYWKRSFEYRLRGQMA